jgi:hypothetical protein
VFRFDEHYATYDQHVVSNIYPAGLNFVVTRSGICVVITEEETVEAFSATKHGKGSKVARDSAVGADMRLLHVSARVGFARGNEVFTIGLN